jgi:hypothetical protein
MLHQRSQGLRPHFIMVIEVQCANPLCIMSFIPRRAGQKYCEQRCAVGHITARRAGFRPTRLGALGLAMATDMLAELESSQLEVVLIPSQDPDIADRGGMIRAVQMANPEWYSELCSRFTRGHQSRKRTPNHDTVIDRRSTLAALRRLVNYLEVSSVYGARLEDFITEKLRHATNNFIFEEGGGE